MGVVSHLCICVCSNDLEVAKQCVSSEVPLHLSSLLVLSISLCWSFLVVCNTNCKHVNTTTIFIWPLCPRDLSPPYICKCHRIQTKVIFCNTDHIYLFSNILLGKGKSILSAVYCFMCKYDLPHSQHNLKDDSLMKIDIARHCHMKICSEKLLFTYVIFVVKWDIYISKTEL